MTTLHPRDLDVDRIEHERSSRGMTVSLLIPARGAAAAAALGDIVAANRDRWMRDAAVIDEIGVLVDPDSSGDTHGLRRIAHEAGASWVVDGRDVLAQHAPHDDPGAGGKAGAMRSLAFVAMGSHLLFHDADLLDYDPMTVGLLVSGATSWRSPRFINGGSPRQTGAGADPTASSPGGRTTEMLRSLLSKQLARHVPGLTDVQQLLIGEFLVDAQLFATLPFSRGYGVETSLKVLALDALGTHGFVEVPLPTKRQTGQEYRDLVKQFHEISFTVDVLERFFLLRGTDDAATVLDIAEHYHDHFPSRTLPLLRPEGVDASAFIPRTSFYAPLQSCFNYRLRREEVEVRRWYALEGLRRRTNMAAHA